MNDDGKPGWLTRLGALLLREPEDRDQLVELLRSASERNLLDEEALAMIEGVLQVAELCAGVMTDASIPADMRWIPKGMTVQYLKKAMGPQTGIAQPRIPIVSASAGYELPVHVEVHDASGEPTFRAEVVMWLSPKPARKG